MTQEQTPQGGLVDGSSGGDAQPELSGAVGAPGQSSSGPPVQWAPPPPPNDRPVPGAPGFSFADTPSRIVAYAVDAVIIGIVGSIVGAIAGEGTTTVSRSATGASAVFAVAGPISTLALFVLSGVYFVLSWTSGGRATPGQRLFHVQVGNAFDGRTLTVNQAIRRWLGFGWFLGLLGLVPSLTAIAGVAELAWHIALLISTAMSPTRQGLHDRFA